MKRPKRWDDLYWTRRIQSLIRKHTRWFTSGPHKGHGVGDSRVWLRLLTNEILSWVKVAYRGNAYDGNLVLSAHLGRALVVWYCACHRAKGLDPNRPLWRGRALRRLAKYKGSLVSAMSDDRLMVMAFNGQRWNFPFGVGREGGKFI